MKEIEINDQIANETKISYHIDGLKLADDDQLSLRCNLYIHELIKQWESSNYQPNLIIELKKNLFPLLIKLRKKQLTDNILISLSSILYHMQKNEFREANQCYMDLSVGKSTWPIGIKSIGIHERRITGLNHRNISNIMKDEETRNWIINIKRLITFKESHIVS